VTIEGTAASGVTVSLSSGQTATTDGSGQYTFSDVSAGAYTVTISGFASDATFPSTSQAATISSAGQVVTVNFDGQFVRSSAIFVGVSVSGEGPLEGVSVTVDGQTKTTGDDGQVPNGFPGLRAGEYTVSIAGFDATQYAFAETSQTVTVGAGESQSVTFSGQLQTTASISGALFLDENDKDDSYTASLEDKLGAAGVSITLEGGGVGVFDTIQTDANGDFAFEGLPAGNYRVEIMVPDTVNVPGNVAFGGASTTELVTLTTGESESVFFPFDITRQALQAAVFYGLDGTNPGVSPRSGITVNLFAQESQIGGTPLASDTTGADGTVTFRFDRDDDTSPGGERDNILFAQIGTIPAFHALNGDTVIELQYESKDSLALAPDTFDVLTNQASVKVEAVDGLGNALNNWKTAWFLGDTLPGSLVATSFTDTLGVDSIQVGPPVTSITSNLPDTFYVRLSVAQPAANGLGYNSDAIAGSDGMPFEERFLEVVFDGLLPPSVAHDAGDFEVTYTEQNVYARVHHEADDSTDSPVFTGGDDFFGSATTEVRLWALDDAGAPDSVVATDTADVADGEVMFPAVSLGDYILSAASFFPNRAVLADTVSSPLTLDGLQQADSAKDLTGNAGYSSFAMKHTNTRIRGTVESRDGVTRASGLQVRIRATDDHIQPNVMDTTLTTVGNGTYSLTGLHEGPYEVMVMDSTTADGPVWSFFDVLTTDSTISSGNADNESANTAFRDTEGLADTATANFQAAYMDTEIAGVVVNDRDEDYNTIDPEEALAGVTVELIEDLDADGVVDDDESVVETTTTDSDGAYSFDQLIEGESWIVRAISTDDFTVLRTLASDGSITNTIGPLTTTAAVGSGAQLNQNGTRQIGNTFPPAQDDELPRWNYAINAAAPDGGNLGAGSGPNALAGSLTTRPTHFIPLYSTGTLTGNIVDGSGDPAEGVTVNVTLCNTAPTVPVSPLGTASGCTTVHTAPSPWIFNSTTNADGEFTFEGLLEGVYEVNIAPATGGYSTLIGFDGAAGSSDEVPLFSIVGNNDVETISDFEVN
jgi:hypothetical protein